MACACCFLSKLIQLILIYGYPAYKVTKTSIDGKLEKLWVIYFLVIGIFSLLEGTLLFPIIFILGKISRRIYPLIKVCFHLWLYFPYYRGALLLDQLYGKFIDLAFLKVNPIGGKLLTKIGIPNRDTEGETKKEQ